MGVYAQELKALRDRQRIEEEERLAKKAKKVGNIKSFANMASIFDKGTRTLDQYNQAMANRLGLVDKYPGAFEWAPPAEGKGFIKNILSDRMRDPYERIVPKGGVTKEALRKASPELFAGKNPGVVDKVFNKGGESAAYDKYFGKGMTLGKGLGMVPGFINLMNSDADDPDAQLRAGIQMAYPWLTGAGPIGWGAIALNELWGLLD